MELTIVDRNNDIDVAANQRSGQRMFVEISCRVHTHTSQQDELSLDCLLETTKPAANYARRPPHPAVGGLTKHEAVPNLHLRMRDSLLQFRTGPAAADP